MQSILTHPSLLAALLLPAALACSGDSALESAAVAGGGNTDPSLQTRSQALQNGQIDTTNQVRAVVHIAGTATGDCSGTLIAPGVILTAAHCFAGFASGCTAMKDAIAGGLVRVAAQDGSSLGEVLGGTLPQDQNFFKNIDRVFVHPDAYFKASQCSEDHGFSCGDSVISCQELRDPAHRCGEDGLDSRHDLAIVTMIRDVSGLPPSSVLLAPEITPIPVLLHPAAKEANKAIGAAIPGAELEDFINSEQPQVTIAGFGLGNYPLPFNPSTTGLTRATTRDLGIQVLFSSRTNMDAVGIPPWGSCIERLSATNALLLVGHPTGIDKGQLSGQQTDDGYMADGTHLPPNEGAPNLQSWVAKGDSGGPLMLGGNLTSQGLAATPLRQSWIDAGYAQPGQHYVAGVVSRGEQIRVGNTQVNNQPNDFYAPTFEPENSKWLAQMLSDLDGDGIPDIVDPCAGDPDNSDHDGDGLIGKCDPNPCCADKIQKHDVDVDQDGVCDICDPTHKDAGNPNDTYCESYCASHPPDGCPNIPDQGANGNRRSEIAQGAAMMGNACDPVPHPYFDVFVSEKTLINSKSELVQKGNTYAFLQTSTYGVVNSKLQLKPVGSHYTQYAAGLNDFPGKREVAVLVANTHSRVCLQGSILGTDCTEASKAVTDDDLLTQGGVTNALGESNNTIWHRIKFTNSAEPGLPLQNLFYNQTNPDSPKTTLSRTWDWQDDYQRWASSWGPQANFFKIPSETGDGDVIFWFNGDTTIGSTSNNNQVGTGYHPLLNDPSLGAPKLANHYGGLPLLDVITTKRFSSLEGKYYKPNPILLFPCLSCPPFEEKLRNPGYPQIGPSPRDGLFTDARARILVLADGAPSVRGMLNADGEMRDVEDVLGEKLKARLLEGSIWVNQAEYSPGLGRGLTLPAAIVLSSDGTGLVDRFYLGSEKVFGQRDIIRSPRGSDGASPTALAAPLIAAAPAAAQPAPRQDFVPVYSRSTGRLFVVGGQSPGTTTPVGDIWWTFVDDGTAQKLRTSFEPQRVLGATYTFPDGSLWVLDQTGSGSHKKARLTRIHTQTGQADTLAEWPWLGLFDQHWLLSDRDGALLVVASSTKLRKHLIVRVGTEGTVKVEGARVGARPLAMAPVVDEEGYWVVTTPKKASKPPKVQRLDTLKLKSLKASKKGDEDEDEGEWEEAPKTPWGHLGGCW